MNQNLDPDKRYKWVFIVNPVAGNGVASNMVQEIKEKIKEFDICGEIVFTERRGHASDLSKIYYENGFRFIIAVGGDGTMNEVARPLINKKDVVTGIIPAGTGNDFIQILGFPDRFTDHDWAVLFNMNIKEIDVGTVNGSVFVNGMGLGFDAEVAAENYTEPGEVKKGGQHKYIWHIVKTLLFFREKQMSVNVGNNRTVSDCFINTVANGRRFAGGFLLTPKAVANDGMLDVCMIKRLNLFQRFRLLLKVPEGKHILNNKVIYYQTAGLNIEFSEKVPFHVDGELFFSKKFEIAIIPGALNTIYNPHGNHFFAWD